MKNAIKKYLGAISFLLILLFATTTQAAFLDESVIEKMNENTGFVQDTAGFDANVTLGEAVAMVIKGFLGLLGIIFIILILIAGYNWMTASGDEEKIKKATSTIRSAVIGLLIIVAAYAITYFVFENLPGASG